MIDEERTFEIYGYTSGELTHGSRKRVVAVCEDCGKYRDVVYQGYRELCSSCSQIVRERHKITKICKQCNEEYKVIPSIAESSKFCCRECKDTWRSENEIGENHRGWKGDVFLFVCDTCGIEYRNNYSNKPRFHFCSNKCHGEWQSVNRAGENSHTWLGGISFGKYCPKFNDRFKQEVRDKYNNCDFMSGLSNIVCNGGRKLDVHHVDYNKQQGCDDNEWRLIPLSRVNHTKTSYNRPFWNRLFTYALQYWDEYYRGD